MSRSSQTFIAVQCVQCCTMQVKQEKKSSNKWTCAICNQKQSLTRVFAGGPQAKELRVFVQGFNMTRADPVSDPNSIVSNKPLPSVESEVRDSQKRRTDWSEYLDIKAAEDDDNDQNENGRQTGNSDEAGLFVTEMPTTKKPNTKKKRKMKEPPFPERRAPPKSHGQKKSAALVPDERKTVVVVEDEEPSKWDEYMEEETELDFGIGETLSNCHRSFWNDRELEQITARDLKVDDEVHPDFI